MWGEDSLGSNLSVLRISLFPCFRTPQSVQSFETSKYRLNLFETPTAMKLVLNTDPTAVGIGELLRLIYQVSPVVVFLGLPYIRPQTPSTLLRSEIFSRLQRPLPLSQTIGVAKHGAQFEGYDVHVLFQIFVDTVTRNPLIDASSEITSELFHARLNEAVERHTSFA